MKIVIPVLISLLSFLPLPALAHGISDDAPCPSNNDRIVKDVFTEEWRAVVCDGQGGMFMSLFKLDGSLGIGDTVTFGDGEYATNRSGGDSYILNLTAQTLSLSDPSYHGRLIPTVCVALENPKDSLNLRDQDAEVIGSIPHGKRLGILSSSGETGYSSVVAYNIRGFAATRFLKPC